MSFQHPIEISGVTYTNFLRQSYNSINSKSLQLGEFVKLIEKHLEDLGLDKKIKSRFVNKGFSGGEKKRLEIVQLLLLEPKYAILDEIDSGLDVDGLKLIAEKINEIKLEKNMGILIITHYNKILEYIKPDKVLILKKGKIEKEGDSKLAKEILETGFN
jgi:Fe-S cluster assembly ATP-binding protein